MQSSATLTLCRYDQDKSGTLGLKEFIEVYYDTVEKASEQTAQLLMEPILENAVADIARLRRH